MYSTSYKRQYTGYKNGCLYLKTRSEQNKAHPHLHPLKSAVNARQKTSLYLTHDWERAPLNLAPKPLGHQNRTIYHILLNSFFHCSETSAPEQSVYLSRHITSNSVLICRSTREVQKLSSMGGNKNILKPKPSYSAPHKHTSSIIT